MRSLISSFLAVLLCTSPAVSAGDQASLDASTRAPGIEADDNLCFGGLEDGKIIVEERFLESPFRQTTRLGCEVDGGEPARMPDLPAPDDAERRLV